MNKIVRTKNTMESTLLIIRSLVFLWPILCAAATADDYLKDAEAYITSGEYEAAVIQLKNAVLLDSNNTQTRLLFGKLYLELQDGPSAVKHLRLARELGAPRDKVISLLGRAYLMSGQTDMLFQDISVEANDSPTTRFNILLLHGEGYLEMHDFVHAKEKFSKALELQPNSVEAMLGKARITHNDKNIIGASMQVDKVLAIDSENAKALALKGVLLRESDKLDEAVLIFQKILDSDPDNAAARLGKASALISLGEQDLALVEIANVQEKYPNLYMVHYLYAVAMYQNQSLKEAQRSVQIALKQAPNHLPSHLLAGTIAYQQGDMVRAEQYLRHFWNSDPSNIRASKLLAEILLQLKQPDKAIVVLESNLELVQNNAKYLSLLGKAYVAQGDTAKGAEYLELATRASIGSGP